MHQHPGEDKPFGCEAHTRSTFKSVIIMPLHSNVVQICTLYQDKQSIMVCRLCEQAGFNDIVLRGLTDNEAQEWSDSFHASLSRKYEQAALPQTLH